MLTHQLLEWVNTHDCGVSPCGVYGPWSGVVVRVLCVNTFTGESFVDETLVQSLAEARAALGY